MDRPPARVHHTLKVPLGRAHQHPPREQVPRIKPTRRVHPDPPFAVDVAHVEPDLIHVAQDHHPGRTRMTIAPPVAVACIPPRVPADLLSLCALAPRPAPA